eukprot:1140753-Pelagomonas_calceolata.AAC.4
MGGGEQRSACARGCQHTCLSGHISLHPSGHMLLYACMGKSKAQPMRVDASIRASLATSASTLQACVCVCCVCVRSRAYAAVRLHGQVKSATYVCGGQHMRLSGHTSIHTPCECGGFKAEAWAARMLACLHGQGQSSACTQRCQGVFVCVFVRAYVCARVCVPTTSSDDGRAMAQKHCRSPLAHPRITRSCSAMPSHALNHVFMACVPPQAIVARAQAEAAAVRAQAELLFEASWRSLAPLAALSCPLMVYALPLQAAAARAKAEVLPDAPGLRMAAKPQQLQVRLRGRWCRCRQVQDAHGSTAATAAGVCDAAGPPARMLVQVQTSSGCAWQHSRNSCRHV